MKKQIVEIFKSNGILNNSLLLHNQIYKRDDVIINE